MSWVPLVQVLGGGDIYTALETRGVGRAAEFVGPYDDAKLGLQETAKYYYAPGWQETGATIALYINLEKWNELPLRMKKIVENLSKACNLMMVTKYDAKNGIALRDLKKQGIQLEIFSNEILEEAEKQKEKLLERYKNTDNHYFNKIYKSIQEFKELSDEWFYANEYQYLMFKYRGRK